MEKIKIKIRGDTEFLQWKWNYGFAGKGGEINKVGKIFKKIKNKRVF